jgi:hypothetical protein
LPSLNRLDLFFRQFVVFLVRSDETDIYRLDAEQDYSYQPVVISFDVEDDPFIPNQVGRVESILQITEIVPFGIFGFFIPLFECGFGVSVLPIKSDERFLGNDSHIGIRCKDTAII